MLGTEHFQRGVAVFPPEMFTMKLCKSNKTKGERRQHGYEYVTGSSDCDCGRVENTTTE